jgi:hypothetical protein
VLRLIRGKEETSKDYAHGGKIRALGLGTMDKMLANGKCSMDSCEGTAVASLVDQDLCLNHFVGRCYERLDTVDPRGRRLPPEAAELVKMREFVEECSHRALDVSLRSTKLTNLDRGRLLDILLWAGELFVLLRAPRTSFADSIACGDSYTMSRVAAIPH